MSKPTARLDQDHYLALDYPFNVIADEDGGYVIVFPDLPGCMTQVETLDEVGPMADEVRQLWIESECERGADIPLPSYPEEYSGKFVLRVSRSLHRSLAESAERENVSLNQYAATVLARGDAQGRIERRLDELGRQINAIHEGLRFTVSGVPSSSQKPEFRVLVGRNPVAA